MSLQDAQNMSPRQGRVTFILGAFFLRVSGRKQTTSINCINFEKYFAFLSLGDALASADKKISKIGSKESILDLLCFRPDTLYICHPFSRILIKAVTKLFVTDINIILLSESFYMDAKQIFTIQVAESILPHYDIMNLMN